MRKNFNFNGLWLGIHHVYIYNEDFDSYCEEVYQINLIPFFTITIEEHELRKIRWFFKRLFRRERCPHCGTLGKFHIKAPQFGKYCKSCLSKRK